MGISAAATDGAPTTPVSLTRVTIPAEMPTYAAPRLKVLLRRTTAEAIIPATAMKRKPIVSGVARPRACIALPAAAS
jgi:hypothetical protein